MTIIARSGIGGVRRLNEMIAAEPRVMATEIQTVGSKGYDGFAVAMVLPPAKGKRWGPNL